MKESYPVSYSPAAKEDLKSIYSYIAYELKEKRIATNQINRIRKEIKSLNFLPERYVRVDWEPWFSMGMRMLTVDNYVIYYLANEKSVTIVRIFYGGRDIKNILGSEN
jgi:toxin ParE1/3/4